MKQLTLWWLIVRQEEAPMLRKKDLIYFVKVKEETERSHIFVLAVHVTEELHGDVETIRRGDGIRRLLSSQVGHSF